MALVGTGQSSHTAILIHKACHLISKGNQAGQVHDLLLVNFFLVPSVPGKDDDDILKLFLYCHYILSPVSFALHQILPSFLK